MRTYIDIYREYCNWLVSKTRNSDFSYESMVERHGEQNAHVFLYQDLLKKCYNKNTGMFYFCKFIIGGLTEIGYPNAFRYNGLLRKWHKLVMKTKYLAILCARGHGKSVFFSQVLNIYDMFLFKFRRIILISASQEQANELLDNMKLIIENNEWLVTKKDPNKWAGQRIGYNGGYVLTAGIGSEILGQHVDRIMVDDILRSDNKLSDQQIEDYIDMNLSPMLLNRNGQMILVGTPKSDKDIFSEVRRRIEKEKKSPWILREFPAIVDYDKKILQCPDRFTWEQIIEKRLTMGALKFGREYQLEFFSREQSLFPTLLLDQAKKKGKAVSLLHKHDNRGPEWTYVMGVDVARSGSVSADYSVAIVLAYNGVTQEKQIVSVWREKGLKISEQSFYIAKLSKAFDNCQVLVEKNNIGVDMIDTLADEYNVGVEEFVTGGKGQKKEELIRFLITAFEHEQIVFPQQDDWSREHINIIEDELKKFCVTMTPAGNERFEGMGSHDDSLCEGTSVITFDGIKNIEDITTTDSVLTHKGNFRQVESTMSKTCKKPIITIKPYGNLPFSLTDYHKVFVMEKPKNNIRKRVNGKIFEIESQHVDKNKHLLVSPIFDSIYTNAKIDMVQYFPTTDGWEYDDTHYWNYRWKEKKYVRFIDIEDKEFAFFMGWYVGDGSSKSLVFHKKDEELYTRITNYMISLGINIREHSYHENYRTFNFCCIPFQKFLKENCGKRENKRLPIFTQYLYPDTQKEIIKGYWSADGSIIRNRMTAHTISKELAFQIRNMFLRNGIVCNINEIKRHRYGVENKNQFVLEVSKYYKEKFFDEPQTTYDFGSSFIKDGYLISCINWHTYEINTELHNVYDLQVKEDKSYCPNGVAIRNCVMSLALANKATQILGVPFAMTNFGNSGGSDRNSNPYGQYITNDRGESDLVKLIRMGAIR